MSAPKTLRSKGTPAQLHFVKQVTQNYGEAAEPTRRFLVYLLLRTVGRVWRMLDDPSERWDVVRVHHRFIERHFRGANWRRLRDGMVLNTEAYDQERGLPYGFIVDERPLRRFVDAGRVRTSDGVPEWVDLYTGRPTTARVKSERSKNRNPLPTAVRSAIDAVGPGLFYAPAVEDHLDRLTEEARDARGVDERFKAELRRLNDERCYRALFEQGAVEEGRGVWSYRPAYRMQRTGRIGQIGGGLQSCSRRMKAAAYSGIPHASNYDLRSSQPRILIVLMEEAGIDARWLRAYSSNPSAKHDAAAAIGIPVDAWKRCLNALLMGAAIKTPSQTPFAQRNALVRALRDETHTEAAFKSAYSTLFAYVEDLVADLRRWHDHLTGPYLDEHGHSSNLDGRLYVHNRVGASFAASGPGVNVKPHELKSRLAAHLLQGREAAFSHGVAVRCSRAGVRVLSHEHDGLVLLGELPGGVVEEAAQAAGLPASLVDFEEKAIA